MWVVEFWGPRSQEWFVLKEFKGETDALVYQVRRIFERPDTQYRIREVKD